MNTDELKRLIDKIKNDKKTIMLIAVAITGMLLIMFSETGNEKEKTAPDDRQIVVSERELANEVELFIENIKGAGKSRVILTFESFEETVYAVDRDENFTAEGKYDSTGEYVIIDNGNGEGGLKLKIISPKIRGVAVVCEGGDNSVIKEQIISAVSALFDISTNKISVAVMAD